MKQRKHFRVSKRGKRFVAGKRVSFRLPEKLPEGVSQAGARELIGNSFEEIGEHLGSGHSVSVPRFGVFKIKSVAARPARRGVNPFTGKEQMFKAKPASKKVKFFASKDLKEGL